MSEDLPMDSTATHLSRRNLLAGLAAGGVVAALAVAIKYPAAVQGSGNLIRDTLAGRRSHALATAEREAWQAAVGSDFTAGHARLRLAGVRPLPRGGPRPASVRQYPFIAVFDLPRGQSLPGNLLYTVRTARVPAFDVFLSETGSAGRLLAVFN
jgi:hypothetical protein